MNGSSREKSEPKVKEFSGPWNFTHNFRCGALLLITILVVAVSVDFNPIGEKVEEMPSGSHVPEGTDPGPSTSDPPTSGMHFPEHFPPEFFHENEFEYPEGFLVHNLEHG